MKEKLIKFMQGRYGVDSFSRFLLAVGLAAVLLSSFFRGRYVGTVCYLLGWIAIIYCYFRMFSRNISKRSAENQWYLRKSMKVRGFVQKKKRELSQMKQYHIYKCPNCRQKIRIPRGKGKIEIRCPKCSTTFIKKS